MNYGYPDASYEERDSIVAEHETYQRGIFIFFVMIRGYPRKFDLRCQAGDWQRMNFKTMKIGLIKSMLGRPVEWLAIS